MVKIIGPAAVPIRSVAVQAGANEITGPACSAKACFMAVGDITTTVNKGRTDGSITVYLYEMSKEPGQGGSGEVTQLDPY